MEPLDYLRIFAEVKIELQSLQDKKVVLETELGDLNARVDAMTKTYNAIAPLVGEPTIPQEDDPFGQFGGMDPSTLRAAGITVAVRTVIESIPRISPHKPMTAAMVRDQLQQMGWDWDKYTNPLATVHTVLKRLSDSGVIEVDARTKEGPMTFHPKPGITDDDVPF
jgi:hypothetical protein